MGLIKLPLFWAYLDDEGKITVKRYSGDRVIENTEKLPFCKGIFGPFEACDMAQARLMVLNRYQLENQK
jgi:hypothetical protein